MTLKLRNPKKLTFVWAGLTIEGFADESFVEISREADAFTDSVGATGDVTREQTNDDRATVTLRLTDTHPDNGALTAVHAADKLEGGGAGVAPLYIKDELGHDLHTAKECWIARGPDPKYSKTSGTNEWKFRCAHLVSISGGS